MSWESDEESDEAGCRKNSDGKPAETSDGHNHDEGNRER